MLCFKHSSIHGYVLKKKKQQNICLKRTNMSGKNIKSQKIQIFINVNQM